MCMCVSVCVCVCECVCVCVCILCFQSCCILIPKLSEASHAAGISSPVFFTSLFFCPRLRARFFTVLFAMDRRPPFPWPLSQAGLVAPPSASNAVSADNPQPQRAPQTRQPPPPLPTPPPQDVPYGTPSTPYAVSATASTQPPPPSHPPPTQRPKPPPPLPAEDTPQTRPPPPPPTPPTEYVRRPWRQVDLPPKSPNAVSANNPQSQGTPQARRPPPPPPTLIPQALSPPPSETGQGRSSVYVIHHAMTSGCVPGS